VKHKFDSKHPNPVGGTMGKEREDDAPKRHHGRKRKSTPQQALP
jgi:hypothetical protein